MTISGDVDIYDRLIMIDNSDLLGVEGNIQWHSGSTDEITNGIINLDGDWYFNNGTGAALEGTNVVMFTGGQIAVIHSEDTSACFNDIVINKTSAGNNTVNVIGAQPLNINGDITVENGIFHVITEVNVGDGLTK